MRRVRESGRELCSWTREDFVHEQSKPVISSRSEEWDKVFLALFYPPWDASSCVLPWVSQFDVLRRFPARNRCQVPRISSDFKIAGTSSLLGASKYGRCLPSLRHARVIRITQCLRISTLRYTVWKVILNSL